MCVDTGELCLTQRASFMHDSCGGIYGIADHMSWGNGVPWFFCLYALLAFPSVQDRLLQS